MTLANHRTWNLSSGRWPEYGTFTRPAWTRNCRPCRKRWDASPPSWGRVQEQYRDGERRAILAKFGGDDRPRVTHGKYKGMDALSLAYVRSVLNAQLREPAGLNQRMLEDWQNNLKAALDSTTAG